MTGERTLITLFPRFTKNISHLRSRVHSIKIGPIWALWIQKYSFDYLVEKKELIMTAWMETQNKSQTKAEQYFLNHQFGVHLFRTLHY